MIIETDLSKVTPTSHRWIGMFRRPFDEVLEERRQHGYDLRLEAQLKLKSDWLAGHFDTPQYERIVPEPDVQQHLRNLADFNDKLNQLSTRISEVEETIKDWRENGVEQPEPTPKSSLFGKLYYEATWASGMCSSLNFKDEHGTWIPITDSLLGHICYCVNEYAKRNTP